MTDEVRDEFADRLASFFCNHAPDQPCAACFAKGQHAYDRLLNDDETTAAAFRANMEVEELLGKVADLKRQAENKFDWGKAVGWFVGATLLGFVIFLLFLLGAWLYQLVF